MTSLRKKTPSAQNDRVKKGSSLRAFQYLSKSWVGGFASGVLSGLFVFWITTEPNLYEKWWDSLNDDWKRHVKEMVNDHSGTNSKPADSTLCNRLAYDCDVSLLLFEKNIRDIAPIISFYELTDPPVSHVKKVILDDNKIESIDGLGILSSIEHLSIRNNNITRLTPLSRLSKLKYLDCRGNNIEDLEPLMSLIANQKDLHLKAILDTVLIDGPINPNYIKALENDCTLKIY